MDSGSEDDDYFFDDFQDDSDNSDDFNFNYRYRYDRYDDIDDYSDDNHNYDSSPQDSSEEDVYYDFDRTNPIKCLESEGFVRVFKVRIEEFLNLYSKISHKFQSTAECKLNPFFKFTVAMFYYANGRYRTSKKDNFDLPISQFMAIKCVLEVTPILEKAIFEDYVKFPKTIANVYSESNKFVCKYGVSDLFGCIGSLKINVACAPNADKENSYVKAQLICGANTNILSVSSLSMASCHSGQIWENCEISKSLQLQASTEPMLKNYFLFGTNDYPLAPWLITPYWKTHSKPLTKLQKSFNKKHVDVYSTFALCTSLLKQHFKCLSNDMKFDLNTTSQIIKVCCALYNFSSMINKYSFSKVKKESTSLFEYNSQLPQAYHRQAIRLRNNIANQLIRK